MTVTHQLTKRIGDAKDAPVWQQARDVQTILNRIPVQEHRIVEEFYKEPSVLGGLQEEPFGIELVRIVNMFAPETPVTACTGFINFVWKPQQGGAVIPSLGGFSIASNGTTKYRFYYRITYRMV